ncbi:hypothetical protein EDB19DRAFT_1898297 [Suillus lakei]|nr:hypothetical protein EDB19DRAFT_1898297 [Suillus lakei]
MCVVFTGQKQRPSRETIKQMRPVLVTKSRVRRLIEKAGVAYSQQNMDALFDDVDSDIDCSVPTALEICHLPRDSEIALNHEGFELRVIDTANNITPGDIVMEAVGFTQGDHSSQSREKMKLHALAYVLDQKRADFVADNDPGLMSYLFPQLDPWDIGGFYHCGRTSRQHISMEAQVRNLLRQDDSPFRKDANFAFICWNMIQKKEVSKNTTFRVPVSQQESLARELKDIGPSLTALAEKWTRSEKKAVRILRRLQASTKTLRGSAGYKLCRRNEIRSLMKKFCTPALFVTLNPHDLTSHIIPTIVGVELDEWLTIFRLSSTLF